MNLSDRQKTAWDHPCVAAEQCADARFHRDIGWGSLRLSTILTLNFGME